MECIQDPEAFETDGGWSFLDMEGDSGEEEEESEEGDPEFQADGDDSEEAGASSEDFRSVCQTTLYHIYVSGSPLLYSSEF